MVVEREKRDRNSYYMKKVSENHTFDEDISTTQDIYLVFSSKEDYKKIRNINHMFKRYFVLEDRYFETGKKYIIYKYLKEMIIKLKEYGSFVVDSDHIEAFDLEFKYIGDFNTSRMKLRLPLPKLRIIDDSDQEDFEDKDYEEEDSENENYYRKVIKIIKIVSLLHEKILN